MNFHSLTIKDLYKETNDSVVISFDIPEHLKKDFTFSAGQYVTIRKTLNGEEVRRAYSIWKAPYEDEISILVKKIENGVFSTYANQELKKGDTLEVSTPQGNFKLMPSQGKPIVLFAAGSGITPIISIVKQQLKVNNNNKVVLFYVNKTMDDIIFKDELEQLQKENPDTLVVHHLLTREENKDHLFSGRINKQKCKEFVEKGVLDLKAGDYYMCGPEQMILEIKEFLLDHKVNSDSIHFELFTSSSENKASTDFVDHAFVTVILDDDEFEFEYNISEASSLLDAGNEHGFDLPYSCKGGVCCTCKAKVIEGSAKMIKNYALSEEEVAQGYVLTCQTHPTSERLVVSFDE